MRLPPIGRVLGVDIGWSERRRSSAVCRLAWDSTAIRLTIRRCTAKPSDIEAVLRELIDSNRFVAAALDGPLRPELEAATTYRLAERQLTRGMARHIGKPGQSSSPNGKRLSAAAVQVAAVLRGRRCLADAAHTHCIHQVAIVEAFPTSFLGVMLRDPRAVAQERGRSEHRSDCYFRVLTAPTDDLAELVERLLPGRRVELTLATIRDHDERAAAVCAITALCVAAGQYIAVGDAKDGWIVLPPLATCERPGLQPWARRLLEQNDVAFSMGSGAE